jgi:hypothetical protein
MNALNANAKEAEKREKEGMPPFNLAKEDPATGRVSGGSFADQALVREIRGARIRVERLQALERDWHLLSEDSKAEIAALFYKAGGR